MRYMLFAGYKYYPCGGMNDFQRDSDTLNELIHYIGGDDHDFDWWHIYDKENMCIVDNG